MRKVLCPNCEVIAEVEALRAGVELECPHCHRTLVNASVNPDGACAVCGKPITDAETIIVCPDCGADFHNRCWFSNEGCATPGCRYVQALKPMDIPLPAPTPHVEPITRPTAAQSPTQAQTPAQQRVALEPERRIEPPRERYEGPFLQDPDLGAKLKFYAIFGFGGAMVGLVTLFSLWLLSFILTRLCRVFFGFDSQYACYVFLSIAAGLAAGVYFAHRKMDELVG